VVKADNTFNVLIDGDVKSTGSLFEVGRCRLTLSNPRRKHLEISASN
jgi:hypothetical protein